MQKAQELEDRAAQLLPVPNMPFKNELTYDLLKKQDLIDFANSDRDLLAYAPGEVIWRITGGELSGQKLRYNEINPRRLQELAVELGGEKATVPLQLSKRALKWCRVTGDRWYSAPAVNGGTWDIVREGDKWRIFNPTDDVNGARGELLANSLEEAKALAESLTETTSYTLPAVRKTNKLVAAIKRGLPLLSALPPAIHELSDEDSPLVRALLR